MSDLTILRENNPASAEFVEAWRQKYQRSFDFSSTEDQAIFYEGMVELARHIATQTGAARLGVTVSTKAVSEVSVSVTPNN